MTAYHIIDIEKTDADESTIKMLELVLCAEYEPATIITDGEGSMYSIYAEFNKPNRHAADFAKGALTAIQLMEGLHEK